MTTSKKTVRTTLDLDQDLHRRLKLAAFITDQPMSVLVRHAIEAALGSAKEPKDNAPDWCN